MLGVWLKEIEMRPTPYDWMSQSPEHRDWAATHYPLMHRVHQGAGGWDDYARSVQLLGPAERRRYLSERARWEDDWGKAWESIGCLREDRLGQHSRRKIYGGRRSGDVIGFMPHPSGTFAGLDEMPVPAGWKAIDETVKPHDAVPVTEARPIQAHPGWYHQIARDITDHERWYLYVVSDDARYTRVYTTRSTSQPGFPKTKNGRGAVAFLRGLFGIGAVDEVKQIQKALNEYYLASGNKIAEDGVWGPATCNAIYWFQYEYVGKRSSQLLPETFSSLYLPAGYTSKYGTACQKWYTGNFLGTPPSEVSGGGATGTRAEIENIQHALNEYYLSPSNKIAEDGIWGPQTCTAAYWYQHEYLDIDQPELSADFFTSLYLPAGYAQKYRRSCKAWYRGDFKEEPPSEEEGDLSKLTPKPSPKDEGPVVEPPPDQPAVEKAGMGGGALLALVGVGLAGLGYAYYRKRKKG